ncbi:MAG: peptide MFS transporter [Thermoanaerobaculia bacterium]|nr:peptide MFS transporter [Thermoanaerobaculia bacterium]
MRNHPSGLPFLFFTEMWERFGYYLMIGIFMLYMTDAQHGGMALDRDVASDIFGTFIALVYLTPFIGGLLADKLLGFRRSIILGGVLMGIGYLMLAIPDSPVAFYSALGVMILGNGFFKPNISVLLGNLYNEERYKSLKDTGYNIFYMGINIGAFVCNFFAAWLRHNIGWGAAFAAAGVGMFIGVIVFLVGMKHYRHADVRKESAAGEMGVGRMLSSVLLPAIVTGIAGWMIPGNVFGTDSTDAFVFGSMPVIGFYLWILWKAKAEDKPRIKSLLAIYAVVIVFWAVFKQNGTALTTWAEFYTDRTLPEWVAAPARAINMAQEVKNDTSLVPKYDSQFRTTRDAEGNIVKEANVDPYFLNIPESERPPKGSSASLISTEIFQSVNPFFVVVLTPLVIIFFSWLRRRGKEPTTPAKIGWGLVVSALSTLVTVAAVYFCHNGAEKASAWWLIGAYGVITVGELCLSPMGLSMVSKMAPPHIVGLMMGGWQLATSLGNKLSGVLATMWDRYDNKADFFWVNFVLLTLAAAALFLLLRWLNRIFREQGLS